MDMKVKSVVKLFVKWNNIRQQQHQQKANVNAKGVGFFADIMNLLLQLRHLFLLLLLLYVVHTLKLFVLWKWQQQHQNCHQEMTKRPEMLKTTIQHLLWYKMKWYETTWYDIIWSDMIWCEVKRSDTIWLKTLLVAF